jgi:hypothetical protein
VLPVPRAARNPRSSYERANGLHPFGRVHARGPGHSIAENLSIKVSREHIDSGCELLTFSKRAGAAFPKVHDRSADA